MRKLKLAYLLAFAPMLMGADDEFASIQDGLVVNTLPICGDAEYLTYTSNGLACTAITAGSLSVPDCKTADQLLTYSMTGEIGVFSCTPKGSESLSASDAQTINTKYQELVNLETVIRSLENGMRSPAAKFCGVTTELTKGKFTVPNTTTVGVAAAAAKCAALAGCGTGARMCSVYDMYNSLAVGKLTQNDTVPKAWVYMAAWQNFAGGATEPTAGLNDNCGGYNYDTANQSWYGTAVKFEARASGEHILKFFTGNGNANCYETLPIACCK
jgi:hypothetical protein